MKKYFLGIDGGGTKTEAVLCDESGHIVHRWKTASTNPNDVGIDTAVDRLCCMIREAHSLVGETVICVFAGVAGALNNKEELLSGLRQQFPNDMISVNSDAINLLSSEIADGDGCCLICGTGSVCFVRHGEKITRIAGWGYLLDSSGSGFSMGREALEAVLRAHDGRGDATLLTGAITQKLDGTPWDKLTEIYEGGKPFIASFAPCVLQCAEEGDRIAFEIIWRQASYLSECLVAAFNTVGKWEETLSVVLGGGIFQASTLLIDLLKQNATVPLNLILAQAPPVFGAVWEAVRQSVGTVTVNDYDVFKRCFMEDYALV